MEERRELVKVLVVRSMGSMSGIGYTKGIEMVAREILDKLFDSIMWFAPDLIGVEFWLDLREGVEVGFEPVAGAFRYVVGHGCRAS